MFARSCASTVVFVLFVALTSVGMDECAQAAERMRAPFDRLLTLVAEVPLGARTDRFDYLSVDSATGRLFIAGMGRGKLLVFDIRNRTLEEELDGFPKITGVLAVPDLHKVYASVPGTGVVASIAVALGMAGLSSGAGSVAIIDGGSLKEIKRLPGGVFPDGIAYDAEDREIFVSDELGGAIGVFDAQANTMITRIAIGGQVGNVQYDPVTRRVYAPVQSRNELVVIDPKRNRIIDHYQMVEARHPHGLRIPVGAAVAYVACDENDRLLVIDLKSGKTLKIDMLGHDPDVLAEDAGLRRLYVASESGVLSVFDISNERAPKPLGDVFVGEDAHSIAVDPDSHQLFLPLRDHNGGAVLRILEPRL